MFKLICKIKTIISNYFIKYAMLLAKLSSMYRYTNKKINYKTYIRTNLDTQSPLRIIFFIQYDLSLNHNSTHTYVTVYIDLLNDMWYTRHPHLLCITHVI